MKERDQDLAADSSRRSCYVSDCRSGEVPEGDNLCCEHHRHFEHLVRFNVTMALIFAEGERQILGQPPN